MKKRIASALICLCMLCGLLPSVEITIDAAPVYNPVYLPFIPLNADTMTDSGYIRRYVMDWNDKGLNALNGPHAMNVLFRGKVTELDKKFQSVQTRSDPKTLAQHNGIYKSGAAHYAIDFEYNLKDGADQTYNPDAVRQYINDNNQNGAGGLKWVAPFKVQNHHRKVNLTENRHSLINVKQRTKKNSGGYEGYYNTATYDSQKNGNGDKAYKGNYLVRFGFNHSVELNSGNQDAYPNPDYRNVEDGTYLFRIEGQTAGGHEPALDYYNLPIFMADSVAPRVTSIKVTGADGLAKTRFKEGETFYFQVAFSEYIRTQNDDANTLNGLALKFQFSGSTTIREAACTGLDGKTLTFSYTVPQQSTEALHAVEVRAIRPLSEQNWATKGKRNPWYAWKRNGERLTYKPDEASYPKLYDISPITDLAGNSVEGGETSLSEPIEVSNTKPEVKDIHILLWESQRTGTSYLGKGTAIGTILTFQKPMRATYQELLGMTLFTNIPDTELKLNPPSDLDNITTLEFFGYLPAAEIQDSLIRFTGITTPNVLKDLYGNSFSGDLPAPVEQYTTDTHPPEITTVPNDGTPVAVTRHLNSATEFYVPVTITDAGSGMTPESGAPASGTFTLTGSLNGEAAEIPFSYKVSGVADQPQSYTPGAAGENAFNLLDGQHFFHIRLDEQKLKADKAVVSNLTLSVTASDLAKNTTEKKVVPLDYTGDFGDSTFERISAKSITGTDALAAGVQRFKIIDPSGIGDVKCKWVPSGTEPENVSWTSDGISDITEDGANWEGSFTLGGLELGTSYDYVLYLQATDKNGNVTESALGYPMTIYVGDANFSYSTATAGTLANDHRLDLITPDTDAKTIAVTVSVDENGDGAAEQTYEKTYSYNPDTAGSTVDIFAEPEISAAKLYGRVTVTMTCNNVSGTTNSTEEIFYFAEQSGETIDYHTVTITAVDATGNETSLGANDNYGGPDGEPLLRQSLAGTSLRVSVSNNLIYPDFGLEDIDFAQSSMVFYDEWDNEIARRRLVKSNVNEIAMPELPAESRRICKAAVELATLSAAVAETATYDGISYYSGQPTAAGIQKSWRDAPYPNGTNKHMETTYFEPSTEVGVITLPSHTSLYASAVDRTDAEAVGRDTQPTRAEFVLQDDTDLGNGITNRVFLKVWNETLEETAGDAQWREMTVQNGMFTLTLPFLPQTAQQDGITVVEGANSLRYCFATANGVRTPEQAATVYASSSQPQLQITAQGYYDQWTKSVSITAEASDALELMAYTDVPDMQGAAESFLTSRQMTITQNGNYYFGVADQYQNVVWHAYPVQNIDTTPPEIIMSQFQGTLKADPQYDLVLATTDDKTLADDMEVFVTVDDVFASDLGLTENAAGDHVLVDLKAALSGKAMDTEIDDTLSVAKGYSDTDPNYVFYALHGIYPYQTVDGAPTDREFVIHVRDAAGNETVSQPMTAQQSNQEPRLLETNTGADAGTGAMLRFSVPVMFTSPAETGKIYTNEDGTIGTEPPRFEQNKRVDWIYQNGNYSVEWIDAWGNAGRSEVIVDSCTDDFFDVAVSKSTLEPTNQDVTVTIDATKNSNVHIGLMTTTDPGAQLPYTVVSQKTDSGGALKQVILQTSQNCELSFMLFPYDESKEPVLRRITIGNIRKEPPAAEIVWYPDNPVDQTTNTTWGSVKAVLRSTDERTLSAMEGDLSYTFIHGGPTEYTFRFRDIYGNMGELKATCPYTIVSHLGDASDTTPPEYSIEALVNRFGSQVYGGSYSASTPIGPGNPLPKFGDSLTLIFSAYDENSVSFSLEGTPSGVTLLGNMVTVNQNTSFTMVLTDANGNETKVTVVVDTKVDTVPTGKVIYKQNSENGAVRAYLDISDNSPERGVTVVGTSGLGYDEEKGMYYRDFYENGTYLFNLIDVYGIAAVITATVDEIDASTPVGTVVLSSPGIFNGETWDAIDRSPTRQNVTLTVAFTKDRPDGESAYLRSIMPSIVGGAGNLEDVTVQNYGDKAVVIFRENAHVKLEFTAANGRSGSLELPAIDFIQRNEPVVTIDKVVPETTGGMTKSVTLTFTADREVYFTGGGLPNLLGQLIPGRTHTKKITQNGDYEFRFIDRAGNTKTVAYTISQINTQPPVLTVSELAEPENYTNQSLTVTASMDMDGTIRFDGTDIPVTANAPVTLTLQFNGFYEIRATGVNGLSVSKTVTVTKIDKTAPVISNPNGTVYASLGSDYTSQALSGVTASDNIDGALDTTSITVLINNGAEIAVAGIYPVQYRAVDSAGNIATLDGWLNIYDGETIALYYNGKFAPPGALTVLHGDGMVQVTTNLGAEPYKLYYARGIKTAAQMKYDGIAFNGTLALQPDVYYTVYLVTQDRREYIGRLLVEQ